MRLVPLALLLALAGCTTGQTYYTPPQAAPLLTEQQAVDVAAAWARSRGMRVERTTAAHLDGKQRWHVKLAGPGEKAEVLVDGVSGRVLKAKVSTSQPAPVPPPAPPPSPQGPPPAQDDWEE
jgi:hypothetical protein